MENIIKELIQIETLAKNVTAKIEQDKKNQQSNIEKSCNDINEKFEAETKQKIQEVKQTAFDDGRKKISQITIETQDKFASIETAFENKRSTWATEIFNSVIGR
ncbi:MAG: hypothetical protein LBU77_07455 [Clostridiales bacterium]|jgi:flagellar biosynthesis/type III secretory pathway protein FliH|nr:hypothetical protein [Clostridiales bacterium]